MLLKAFRIFESRSVEELEDLVTTVASGTVQYARSIEGNGSFRCHTTSSQNSSLFYLVSQFSSEFSFAPVDYIRFVFQLEQSCRVHVGGTELNVNPRSAGYVLPEDVPARQPILTATRELNELDERFHPAYLAEIETLTLTRLLLHTRHNHSSLLETKTPHTSVNRLHLALDYIHANWNRAVTLEDLASLTGVSGRTIFQDFVQRYGETPREYVKRLRLQKARAMLLGGSEGSVMSVALNCGFSSLGHFAQAYRQMFGELPSETGKKANDAPGSRASCSTI